MKGRQSHANTFTLTLTCTHKNRYICRRFQCREARNKTSLDRAALTFLIFWGLKAVPQMSAKSVTQSPCTLLVSNSYWIFLSVWWGAFSWTMPCTFTSLITAHPTRTILSNFNHAKAHDKWPKLHTPNRPIPTPVISQAATTPRINRPNHHLANSSWHVPRRSREPIPRKAIAKSGSCQPDDNADAAAATAGSPIQKNRRRPNFPSQPGKLSQTRADAPISTALRGRGFNENSCAPVGRRCNQGLV